MSRSETLTADTQQPTGNAQSFTPHPNSNQSLKDILTTRYESLYDQLKNIDNQIETHEAEIADLHHDREFVEVRLHEINTLFDDVKQIEQDEAECEANDEVFLCPDCNCSFSLCYRDPETGLCPECLSEGLTVENPVPDEDKSQQMNFIKVKGTKHLEYEDFGEGVNLRYMGSHPVSLTWDAVWSLVDTEKENRGHEIVNLLGPDATQTKKTALNQFVKAVEDERVTQGESV